jgi:hypothetical protein
MREPDAYDQAEFLAALERHAPEQYAGLRNIAKGPPAEDVAEVAARLAQWGADVPWLRRTILDWIPDVREWGSKIGRPAVGGGSREHGATLSLSWEPADGENRAAFRARALRALDAYERHVAKWARAHGIARAYERRRALPVGLDRWKPLVLHCVRDWSIERVARQHGLDGPEAARKAVKDLATRLGFTVRLRRKGADRN